MRISEFELIEYMREITESYGVPGDVVVPNGDDCLVFRFSGHVLLTTDTMVDGVHFISKKFSCYDVGVKSAVSNLSDVAAMGGYPLCALISLVIPQFLEVDDILDAYRGLCEVFSEYGVYVGGGNVSRGRDFTMTVTLFGKSPDTPLTRRGAREGDLIFVSGFVGDSSLGLEILLEKGKGPHLSSVESYLVSRHIHPTPRIELGQSLVGVATSCIDISDGFVQDIKHILDLSGVGARIFLENLPISAEYSNYVYEKKKCKRLAEFFKYSLSGGEDYELVFTVPPELEGKVLEMSGKVGVPVTKVGEITGSAGEMEIYYLGEKFDSSKYLGWKHF